MVFFQFIDIFCPVQNLSTGIFLIGYFRSEHPKKARHIIYPFVCINIVCSMLYMIIIEHYLKLYTLYGHTMYVLPACIFDALSLTHV